MVVVIEAALGQGPRETRWPQKEALATLSHGHGVDTLCRRRSRNGVSCDDQLVFALMVTLGPVS